MQRPPKRSDWPIAVLAACLAAAAAPAWAQRGPGLVGGLLRPVGQAVGDLRGDVDGTVRGLSEGADQLADARLATLKDLVRANPQALELDAHGDPVVRAEVLAIALTPDAEQAAGAAGFKVIRRTRLDPLDIAVTVLSPPPGLSAKDALRRLRKLDPQGQYDLDHIYQPSGVSGEAAGGPSAGGGRPARSAAVVGMLDTGVQADHPALAGSRVEQQAFAAGGLKIAAHGTQVASLMVGEAPQIRSAAPGARLYAADVYGAGPTGGSADAIIRALAWMAQQRVPVVNVSLVGPPNLTLEAAVKAMIARGEIIVAPVGNDGPAAPPLYPASYPGVVAVTAVDAHNRPLLEDGQALHVDFAAQGADVQVARLGGGFVKVRGTSFAAPIVSGRLAVLLAQPDPPGAKAALIRLARTARPVSGLGHGVVGADPSAENHPAAK